MPTNSMAILYEQNYNAQAENVREDFIPENLPTVQHVQINFGLKHRSLTYHHGILNGGLGAMSSGVYQVRLCINVPCVSVEWHEQEVFLKKIILDGCSRVGEGKFPR